MFGHRKTFVKKRTEIHFSMFIESQNWDLKFVFQFDNENEKRKKNQNSISFENKNRMSLSTRGLDWNPIRAPKVSFCFLI